MYGKSTETAIAAVSRLAERWDGGKTLLSAADIAESRGLQKPFVSKVLSALAQAGIVQSTRGPGGGFTLGRPPDEIRLYDVYRIFEREEDGHLCPFGGGICGVSDPCPIHDRLVAIKEQVDGFLHGTTFEEFRRSFQDEGRRPVDLDTLPAGPRRSYRASRSDGNNG